MRSRTAGGDELACVAALPGPEHVANDPKGGGVCASRWTVFSPTGPRSDSWIASASGLSRGIVSIGTFGPNRSPDSLTAHSKFFFRSANSNSGSSGFSGPNWSQNVICSGRISTRFSDLLPKSCRPGSSSRPAQSRLSSSSCGGGRQRRTSRPRLRRRRDRCAQARRGRRRTCACRRDASTARCRPPEHWPAIPPPKPENHAAA